MNKLSYGLISLLSTKPMTGYDLTQKINMFWRTTHSAVYPSLSELEEKGYIECSLEEQTGKPDKKIYYLTASGLESLKQWFTSETSERVVRDELSLKFYCIKMLDDASAEKLINAAEAMYQKKYEKYKKVLEKLSKISEEHNGNSDESLFGAYILTQQAINECLLRLQWCRWVKNLYKNKDFHISNENFIQMIKEMD